MPRACGICGKPYRKSGLPFLKDAMEPDCGCAKIDREAEEKNVNSAIQIDAAGIPKRLRNLTIETYPDQDSHEVLAVREYFTRRNPGLMLLVGAVGRGKSGLACAALEHLSMAGSIRYFYAYDLLTDRVTGDTMEVLRSALLPKTIVIDEIGLQLKTDAAKEFMERILVGRHDDLKNTILISNLPAKEFEPLIGKRAWDRAKYDGSIVVFAGESFRSRV
jgi:DNA replication protein DnaC